MVLEPTMEIDMKKRLITFTLIILSLTAGFILPAYSLQGKTEVVTVSSNQAAKLIVQKKGDSDFVILDIRTPGEYQAGHIPGAILIDFYSTAFVDQINRLDKTKAYLVHCRSGNRSGRSMELFRKLKFNEIYHMSSGIIGWNSEGLALIK
jgi:rhodanese-related sulfurtransferase